MQPDYNGVLVRYHEIALKKKNRGLFEKRLITNIQNILKDRCSGESQVPVIQKYGRMIVDSKWNSNLELALRSTFGISSFSPCVKIPTEIESIEKMAISVVSDILSESKKTPSGEQITFRVLTRRSEKALVENSLDIDRRIGTALCNQFPALKVNLKEPSLTVGIEIRRHISYLWVKKFRGLNGLPIGTTAKLLALISGGIDSPVAALNSMKRGADLEFLHFHGAPFINETSLFKVEDLMRQISKFSPKPLKLFVVSFGQAQEKIALTCPPRYRTVLYRRLMLRVACRLAETLGSMALVTGESIGQVASQTIENISCIEAASALPIFRPLITFNKEEIIAQAEFWKTFEISIREGEDCCTLFADRHPSTSAKRNFVEQLETGFDVEGLVKSCLDSIRLKSF